VCDVVGGRGRIYGSACHRYGMKDIGFTFWGRYCSFLYVKF
jgi:hypothetical protein